MPPSQAESASVLRPQPSPCRGRVWVQDGVQLAARLVLLAPMLHVAGLGVMLSRQSWGQLVAAVVGQRASSHCHACGPL